MSPEIKYIGMDVHKEATVIAVVSGSGKLVMESILETKASSVLQFVQGLPGELHVGLDLGNRSSWYRVLDEAGEVVGEQKMGTIPKATKEVFATMPRSRIGLETGMHSPWVSRRMHP